MELNWTHMQYLKILFLYILDVSHSIEIIPKTYANCYTSNPEAVLNCVLDEQDSYFVYIAKAYQYKVQGDGPDCNNPGNTNPSAVCELPGHEALTSHLRTSCDTRSHCRVAIPAAGEGHCGMNYNQVVVINITYNCIPRKESGRYIPFHALQVGENINVDSGPHFFLSSINYPQWTPFVAQSCFFNLPNEGSLITHAKVQILNFDYESDGGKYYLNKYTGWPDSSETEATHGFPQVTRFFHSGNSFTIYRNSNSISQAAFLILISAIDGDTKQDRNWPVDAYIRCNASSEPTGWTVQHDVTPSSATSLSVSTSTEGTQADKARGIDHTALIAGIVTGVVLFMIIIAIIIILVVLRKKKKKPSLYIRAIHNSLKKTRKTFDKNIRKANRLGAETDSMYGSPNTPRLSRRLEPEGSTLSDVDYVDGYAQIGGSQISYLSTGHQNNAYESCDTSAPNKHLNWDLPGLGVPGFEHVGEELYGDVYNENTDSLPAVDGLRPQHLNEHDTECYAFATSTTTPTEQNGAQHPYTNDIEKSTNQTASNAPVHQKPKIKPKPPAKPRSLDGRLDNVSKDSQVELQSSYPATVSEVNFTECDEYSVVNKDRERKPKRQLKPPKLPTKSFPGADLEVRENEVYHR